MFWLYSPGDYTHWVWLLPALVLPEMIHPFQNVCGCTLPVIDLTMAETTSRQRLHQSYTFKSITGVCKCPLWRRVENRSPGIRGRTRGGKEGRGERTNHPFWSIMSECVSFSYSSHKGDQGESENRKQEVEAGRQREQEMCVGAYVCE